MRITRSSSPSEAAQKSPMHTVESSKPTAVLVQLSFPVLFQRAIRLRELGPPKMFSSGRDLYKTNRHTTFGLCRIPYMNQSKQSTTVVFEQSSTDL